MKRLEELIQEAARDLPTGVQIQITVERWSGWVSMSEDGIRCDPELTDLDIHEQFAKCLTAATSKQTTD